MRADAYLQAGAVSHEQQAWAVVPAKWSMGQLRGRPALPAI